MWKSNLLCLFIKLIDVLNFSDGAHRPGTETVDLIYLFSYVTVLSFFYSVTYQFCCALLGFSFAVDGWSFQWLLTGCRTCQLWECKTNAWHWYQEHDAIRIIPTLITYVHVMRFMTPHPTLPTSISHVFMRCMTPILHEMHNVKYDVSHHEMHDVRWCMLWVYDVSYGGRVDPRYCFFPQFPVKVKYGDRFWPLIALGSLMFIPGSYHTYFAYNKLSSIEYQSFFF